MRNVVLVLLLFVSIKGIAQSQTRKVLFLGNSYTSVNNLPEMVAQLASNTGDVLIYDSHLPGGYTLQDHFGSTVSKNKILANDWDYIMVQEQSQRPAFIIPALFMDGFSNLKNYIKQNKPCAQITSYMTWGHQNGDTQNCPGNPGVCTYDGMQNLLTERYMTMSDLFESEVTPVGVVWKYVKENHPGIGLYQADGSHPTLTGSYLAACCFYTTLFRKDPSLISHNYGLDANTASIIRNAVKSLVFDYMSDWYIGRYVPQANFNYIIGSGSNEIAVNSHTPTYRDSFVWDFGDGTTSSALLPSHSYANNGTYTIRLTSYKCYLGQTLESSFERTVNFCGHTNTIYPNLLLCPDETGILWTQPADSYQWCDDFGNPIDGATNQSLVVFPGLSYSVLTTTNGCTERSPQMFVDSYTDISECNLGVIDIEKPAAILLVPNPVQNILTIETKHKITQIGLYDLSGKQLTADPVSATALDVSRLQPGTYFLRVELENEKTFSRKIIKQ